MQHIGQQYVTDVGGYNGRYTEVYKNSHGEFVDQNGKRVYPVR